MPLVSVFTPSYNRADKLYRVFNSLMNQSFKDFEWIIVDDGSKDATEAVVENFIRQNPFFTIRYHYQENGGKHIAINKGVEMALGQWFYIADSDDEIVPAALQTFMQAWDEIPDENKFLYSGLVACCKDQFGKRVSDPTPADIYDGNWRDLYYRHKFRREATNINKTACMRAFPFPSLYKKIYFPEGIIWRQMSDKYKIRLIDEELRVYYIETGSDSLMTMVKKYSSEATGACLERADILNNDLGYFKYYPVYFCKSAVIYYAYKPFLKTEVAKTITLNRNAAIFAFPFIIAGWLTHLFFRLKGK